MNVSSEDASGKIGLMNLSNELLLMIVEQSNITSCVRLSRVCSRLNVLANYVLYKPDTDKHDTGEPDTDEPETDELESNEPEIEGQETIESKVDKYKLLVKWAMKTDIYGLRALLAAARRRQSFNKRIDGILPLHMAVYENNIEIAKFFIEQGVDVNELQAWPISSQERVTGTGSSALCDAIWGGFNPIAKLLIEKGACLSGVDIWNRGCDFHAIHAAAMGNTEMVQFLLDKYGSWLAILECEGWTPLRFAAEEEGTADIARTLMAAEERAYRSNSIGHNSDFSTTSAIHVKLYTV